ncbi:MAG: hypothetical protein K0U37_02055 [Gammaproteobacteria bacterium]|nr:hypothetical protein [Gammaproteobacteria bacterium]
MGFKSGEIQEQIRKENGFIERNKLGRELRALGFSWSDYANAVEVDIKVKEEKAKLSKVESVLFDCKILSEIYDDRGYNSQFLPFTLLVGKAFNAITVYAYSEHSPEDLAAFKKTIEAATDACIQHYQTKVEPGILDYIKAVGLALIGAIIGLATFPGLVSSDYRGWLGQTFFSGVSPTFVDNDKSKAVQAGMKDGTLTDDILNWQAPVPGA